MQEQDFSESGLRECVARLESKLSELDAAVRPLLAEIDKTKQQLELVKRLLRLETKASPIPESAICPGEAAGGTTGMPGSVSIGDVLAGILQASERPLHISEIRERFLA